MYNYQIICVTNRHLVDGDFYAQMENVFKLHPASIIVREKDMTEEEYKILAKKLLDMGKEYEVVVRLHTFYNVARELGCDKIHLPLKVLEDIYSTSEGKNAMAEFREIGTSVHSMDDVKKAERLGVTYLTAGHIFETDCKKGLPGRGINFLKKVCNNTDIPVYAIGGIDKNNMQACIDAGAAGVCIMSGFMKMIGEV